MADDKALKQWVADQLHSLLGFSNSAISAFIVSQAKRHKTVDGERCSLVIREAMIICALSITPHRCWC